MFEKIIENALQKILGDYVEGLDGESLKLGVWSGDATVENLKLKPDAIIKLGLPFLVKFSYLGKLVLKVPWKSIQSSPLQATLDELIIELEPLNEKDWKFGAVNPEEVLQQIDNFKANLIASLQEKQQQKDGMMDRLIIKIVENIQVKINNIHLRVNVKKQGCAFGVVLQTLTCLTVNEKGQETFIDRTSEANKNLPLIKQLRINQFGVYWNTQAEQLDEQRLKNIFTVSGQDYLFLLDLNAQLTQPPINSKDLPSFALEFNLNQIDIKLSKFQLQQIITFSEYLRSYRAQKKLYIKSKMPKEVPKQLLERFLQLYQQVPLDKKAPQGLSQNDQKEILQILSQISFEDLEVHLKNLIKKLQLEEMKKNALKKKEQSQGGFLGLFAKKKPQEDINLNEEEQNEIIQFLDRNFSGDVQQQQVKTYYVKALLMKGSISIINERKQHRDQFSIIFQQLTFEYVKSGLINTELRDLLLEFNYDSQNHQLLQKNQEVQMEQEAFMTINLIDNLIKLKTRSSTIQFNPNIIPVLQDYIALNVNADIISEAQDAADQAIIDLKQNVKQQEVSKYNYLIETDSLLIKLPITVNQYWIINPGKLYFKGQSKDYEIKLSNIGFSHFVGQKQRSIIQDFNIEASIALIPNQIKCNISIQEIGITINQESYLKIIDISQCFEPSISLDNYKSQSLVKQTVNLLEQNKQYLTQNCTKLGPLFIREGLNWQKYICVLKDPYLYGFKSVKDDYPVFYKWIRHSTFEQQPLDEYGMHILEISNLENTFQISSNKESQLKDWRDHFEKDADQSEIVQKQEDNTQLSIQLELQQVSIRLIDLGEKPFFLLQTNKLQINFDTAPNQMDIKLILKGIYAEDFLNKYEDPSLKYILDQGDVGGELVSISLIRYTDVNKLFMDLSFGNIRVNFKCEVFAYILQFFLTDAPEHKQIQNIIETPTDNPDMEEYLDAEQQLERIQIKVHINQIHVIIVNQITKLKYFDLGFTNCNSLLIIYTNSKSFDLTLGNLFIRDLTNYPNTLFDDKEWNLIKPQNLLYNSDEKQSLIEFKLILRDDQSKLAKQNNNITMDIKLKLSQIILNYIQQPALRIIDYCKLTVADTFIKPNSFKVKGSQIRPIQLNRQMSKIINDAEQQPPLNLDSLLKNPYRMKIQVEINNPQIIVESLLSKDNLILDLGKIIVTNEKKLQNDIWREFYYINLSNLTLKQTNDFILENCDLKLDVSMPDLVELYKFKQIEVSQTIEVDSKFSPVLLKVTNQHLNSINKSLAYNINLDDHFDDFMTCNWGNSFQDIDKAQQLQIIEQAKDQKRPTNKVFVHYTLNLANISILVQENEDPLIKLQIIGSNLDFKLLRNTKKEILFTLQSFKGSQFVKQNNYYKQLPLIGTHSVKNVKHNNIKMIDQDSEILENRSITMVKLQFNLNPINIIKHFKVDLKLEGFSFVVWLKELLELGQKFQFEQIKLLDNKFQGWTEIMAQQAEKDSNNESQQTQQEINVTISNLLFLIPKSIEEKHVIVAKTNLQFIFNKYELSTIPQLLQNMSEKCLEIQDIQLGNYDFKAHLTIQDLEVFMSNKEKIFESVNILSCPKRQIISPIKTTVNMNRQLQLHEYLEHFIDSYTIQIIIQDIHIRVTFIDILILREFFNTLMPQKQGDAQQIESKQLTIEKNQAAKIDGKQYKAEFKLSIIEIEFLNDIDNNYQKLAKFLLSENTFTYKLTDVVTEIKYLAYMNLSYYNTAVQEWEPVIEPTDYEIIYTIDEATSQKLFIFFNQLNVNFSTKMFHVLYDASMLLKQKLSKDQKNQVIYEEEGLLTYGIYNLTGFNMFVEPQIDKNLQLIVENNQIQHFTLSGQNQKVNIQISYGNFNEYIKNVTFRKNKTFNFKIKNETILQKNIVDEGTNKKIAVFTGQYLINNMTHNLLTLLFEKQEYNLCPYIESQNYKLSKSQLAVPFQHLFQILTVEFYGVRARLQKLDYISKHLNQHLEIQFTNRGFISMYCQKDPTLEGRYIINFLPIYRFINLLPFPIKYMIYSDKQEATKLEILGFKQQTDVYEVKREAVNGIQLYLEGYERSMIIDLNINLSQGNQMRVNIQGQQWQGSDGGQNEIILEMDISKYQQSGLKFIQIYSSTYIRNFTPYELIYYQGDENCHIVGGQIQGTKTRIMLLKQTQENNSNLLLASRNSPRVISQNRAQLKLLGRSQTEVFIQEQNKYKLTPIFVRSEIKVVEGIIQKIITLRPKIILVNQTNHILSIQNGFSRWDLDQNSRQPLQLVFVNVVPQLGNEFQYKFKIQIENFEKSCDLEILGPNQIFFQLKLQNDPKVRTYFQVDVIDFNDQLFAVFSQPAQPPYRIINKSKIFNLYIDMIPTTLEENQHVDFAYDDPFAKRVILVNFLSLVPNLNSEQKKIETEKLLNHKMLKFKSNNLVYWVRLKIYIQGNTKLIVFSDANDIVQKQFNNVNMQNLEFDEGEELVKFEDKKVKSNYQLIIPKFNLSVIENYKSKPMELISLTINGFETFVIENLNKKLLLQIILKELQLDNNESQALCPVVIKSQIKQNILVSLIIEYDLRAEVIGVFDSIRLEILPLQITLDNRFLNAILEYTKIVDQIISDCEYRQKIEQQEINWQDCVLPPPDKPTYIKQFMINTLDLQVSFFLGGDKKGSKITSLIGAVGLKLVNIDEANLKFSGLRMIDVYDNFNLLTQKIIIHYKDEALSQLPVLIGSLAILGNPLKLLKSVTAGLVDFVEKPMEGINQGPKQIYEGFQQGTQSLVSNTVAGTFDTVKTITGAVSSGLTQITMDDDYMRDRQRKSQLEKPQNFKEGIQEGSKSLFKGLVKGITGVVTKPFEGAQQGGATGFAKGLWQGTTGLVMKPVVGAIDVVTMTSEGIKNSIGPNKSTKSQRQRTIRPIYDGQYYDKYNQVDALGFDLMNTLQKSKYQDHEFFKAVEFINQSSYLMIFTNRIVILYDTNSEQQIWGIKLEQIKKVEIIERSLIRIFSKRPKSSWKVYLIFYYFNPEQFLDFDKWKSNGTSLQIPK